MVSGATVIQQWGSPVGEAVSYKCNDNTAIEKGDLLWFSDPYTVSGATTTGKPFAGIAAFEKVAGDGVTQMGVWTKGVYDLVAVGAGIGPGTGVVISGVNTVAACPTTASGGFIVGYARELSTAAGEVIQVILNG